MRIGCLQFGPQLGDIDGNMDRANAILNKAGKAISVTTEARLDFLVLSKMVFSGSDFAPGKIDPYLEPAGGLATRLWAKTAAIRYNCEVVVGYPQKVDNHSAKYTNEEFFSCCTMTDRNGDIVADSPERTLNQELPILSDIETDFGRVCIGQYTDFGDDEALNVQESRAFADHIISRDVSLAIFSMAWKTRRGVPQRSKLRDEDALNCWTARLRPLVEARLRKEIIVVLCNRIGREGDAVYAGTSTVLSIRGGEIFIFELMGSRQQGILFVDTSEVPKYEFVLVKPKTNYGSTGLYQERRLQLYQEQVTDCLDTADLPQSRLQAPDTQYRGYGVFKEYLQKSKPIFGDKSLLPEKDPLTAVRMFPPGGIPWQSAMNTMQARPKVDVSEPDSTPPRKTLTNKHRTRAASKSRSEASIKELCPSEASTPHPADARTRLRGYQTSRPYPSRTRIPPALATPTTPFEDGATDISPSPQLWNPQGLPVMAAGSRPRQNLARCSNEPEQARIHLSMQAQAPPAARLRFPYPSAHTSPSVFDKLAESTTPAIKRPNVTTSRFWDS